jgi:hypothetical protein
MFLLWLFCFSLFIDDMTKVLEFLKNHMYADDLQIYHSQPREMLFEFIREVNSYLSKVFEWFFAYSLKLNPLKAMVLPINRNHLLGPLPALFLADDFVPYVFKAKNLGVTFSYNLNWGDHDSTICRKVYGALAELGRLTDVTPFRRSYATCCCACDSFFSFNVIVSNLHSILIR